MGKAPRNTPLTTQRETTNCRQIMSSASYYILNKKNTFECHLDRRRRIARRSRVAYLRAGRASGSEVGWGVFDEQQRRHRLIVVETSLWGCHQSTTNKDSDGCINRKRKGVFLSPTTASRRWVTASIDASSQGKIWKKARERKKQQINVFRFDRKCAYTYICNVTCTLWIW